jgi:5'-nucleotidase
VDRSGAARLNSRIDGMSTTASRPEFPPPGSAPSAARRVFCNRTLNLRAIKAIGYDMDYTLIHYNVEAWERKAFSYLQQKLLELGWPVADLSYTPSLAVRGLVIDTELGNLVKADRFGYVKRAYHGTERLDFDRQRHAYARTLVDVTDARWVFLNTFFSLSEAAMYAQLVDRLDQHAFTPVLGYGELWARIRHALDQAHAEGRLKSEIIEQPGAYIELDPDLPLALLDQKEAGKRLLLVTNSEWVYTREMMRYAFDRFLPAGATWRTLFDLVIVSARKPDFFSFPGPLFEIVDEDGLLRPVYGLPKQAGLFLGGHAEIVEQYLGLSGSEILYIGDHLYTDVRASKDVRRWRTGLIVRELEEELVAVERLEAHQARLDALMAKKAALEDEQAHIRLRLLRVEKGYGPADEAGAGALEGRLARLRGRIEKIDAEIAPLAGSLGAVFSQTWGPLMSAGADPSFLARQLEDSADLYTSRVSNLLHTTPFAYLRAPRGQMPHDV